MTKEQYVLNIEESRENVRKITATPSDKTPTPADRRKALCLRCGIAAALLVIAFFFVLIAYCTVSQRDIPPTARMPLVFMLALTLGVACGGFIGGTVRLEGDFALLEKLRLASPMRLAATGGIAAFLLAVLVGFAVYAPSEKGRRAYARLHLDEIHLNPSDAKVEGVKVTLGLRANGLPTNPPTLISFDVVPGRGRPFAVNQCEEVEVLQVYRNLQVDCGLVSTEASTARDLARPVSATATVGIPVSRLGELYASPLTDAPSKENFQNIYFRLVAGEPSKEVGELVVRWHVEKFEQ